jgi:hypothetical protein
MRGASRGRVLARIDLAAISDIVGRMWRRGSHQRRLADEIRPLPPTSPAGITTNNDSSLRGCPGRSHDLRGKRNEAVHLRIRFPVGSGRYPSLFDVMRDRYGIGGVQSAITTLASAFEERYASPRRHTHTNLAGLILIHESALPAGS